MSAALLRGVGGRHRGLVTAAEAGVVAGTLLLAPEAAGVPAGRWTVLVAEGAPVEPARPLVEVCGSAGELAVAEDYVMGALGFASGVATRASGVRAAAPGGLRVVCGAWKKLPAPLKPLLRAGLAAAGVAPRLLDEAFAYVDKNAVRLLGGVAAAVAAGLAVGNGPVAVQVRCAADAVVAVRAGAGVVVVDTGVLADLSAAHAALDAAGVRRRVTLAYAGGVTRDQLTAVQAAGADVVDVGRAILDAPLLDLRFDVVDEERRP